MRFPGVVGLSLLLSTIALQILDSNRPRAAQSVNVTPSASQVQPPAAQNPQTPAKDSSDPRTWPYYSRSFARVAGNVGGWWSFMNENEKTAFLDGFQVAMSQANEDEKIVCEAMRQEMVKDPNPPVKAISAILFVCSTVSDTADYDKVTIKDLDDFYSDPTNQPISLEWSMGYLRDKASGRKTKGQLLDALEAEQKDVHDCSKYPHLCKLGAKESEPSQ